MLKLVFLFILYLFLLFSEYIIMSEDQGIGKPCFVKSSKDTAYWKIIRIESYHELLDVVEERVSVPDGIYVDIQGHLKQLNIETFIEKKPMWHRSCYSDTTKISI